MRKETNQFVHVIHTKTNRLNKMAREIDICTTFLCILRFSDIYDRENIKAALLHPFFKSRDFLESSDAPIGLKGRIMRELKEEVIYIQDKQREQQPSTVLTEISSCQKVNIIFLI
jgi:hypothetical protein